VAPLAEQAERVRSIDRTALAVALARAGLQPPPRIFVTLVAEADVRATMAPRRVAGLAVGADRITIFPGRVGPYPYGSLEAVVWHEIAHAALTAQADGGHLPRWFHEGVATSVEQDWGWVAGMRLLLSSEREARLPVVEQMFESAAADNLTRAYLLSAALVSSVRERAGPAVPGAIADDVARGLPFPMAFARHTGQTPAQAAALAWQPYLDWIAWIPVVTSGGALWTAIMLLAFLAFAIVIRRRVQRREAWDPWDE